MDALFKLQRAVFFKASQAPDRDEHFSAAFEAITNAVQCYASFQMSWLIAIGFVCAIAPIWGSLFVLIAPPLCSCDGMRVD